MKNPYLQGYLAFGLGKSKQDNPYKRQCWRDKWEAGFTKALSNWLQVCYLVVQEEQVKRIY